MIGVTVLPRAVSAPAAVAAKATHKLQLVISENPDKIPLYRLEVNDPQVSAEPNKKKVPSLFGPPILLTRGEETGIDVKT